MYKGKRYNAIVVLLLFIISIVVGFSAGMSKNSPASGESGWQEELPEDLVPEENNEQPTTPGVTAPGADASAFERLAFAMDYLQNGAGYTSYLYQTLDTAGNMQYMAYKKYRGGGLDLTEEWYKFDALLAILKSLGKHEFRSYYSDGTNMKYKNILDSKNFDFNAKTYNYKADHILTEFTAEYYQTVYNRTKLNNFFTTINENTVTIEKYDKKTDPDNYVIRVSIPQDKLDNQYITTFTANGASNLNIKTEVVTFKINKKTGFLSSYEKYEVFSASQSGITLDFVINLKETYTSMNRSAESTIRNIVSQSFGI